MTKQSLLKRLTQNVRQWNIWRQQHPRASIDLIEANLSYAHLSYAHLSRATLLLVTLSGADLSDANLIGANLIGADLSDANLSGANLSDATLSGANLIGANLSKANLIGADLSEATLNRAHLSGAHLSNILSSNTDHNTAFSASDLHLSPPGSSTENTLLFSTKEAEKATQPLQPLSILYCYTPQDRKLRDQLETHLMVLKRLKQITLRLNREILAGMDWKVIQDDHFHHADVILLLISPDFVASDYHYGIEMHHALEKHKAGNVWVIPILLRPTPFWQQTPLGTLPVLPQNGKAITDHQKRDQVLAEVVRRIGEVVSLLLLKKYPSLHTESANKATQALGPFCVSCGARNPSDAPVCENCGDVLL
jgi:uncharacterized protein YjbI with pentapeptide repeats